MTLEEALKVLLSKGYRIHAMVTSPENAKTILFSRRGRIKQLSEDLVIKLAKSYEQDSLGL